MIFRSRTSTTPGVADATESAQLNVWMTSAMTITVPLCIVRHLLLQYTHIFCAFERVLSYRGTYEFLNDVALRYQAFACDSIMLPGIKSCCNELNRRHHDWNEIVFKVKDAEDAFLQHELRPFLFFHSRLYIIPLLIECLFFCKEWTIRHITSSNAFTVTNYSSSFNNDMLWSFQQDNHFSIKQLCHCCSRKAIMCCSLQTRSCFF